MKAYTLILGAIPGKDYGAGWLAGSVIAHKIRCEQRGKVFWFCPFTYRGVAPQDKETFSQVIRSISNQEACTEAENGGLLNRRGFFYDGADEAVSWCFDLEGVFVHETLVNGIRDKLSNLKVYLGFRDVYLAQRFRAGRMRRAWFLLSNIQRIQSPFKKVRSEGTMYRIPSFKLYSDDHKRVLRTSDFRAGGAVFAVEVPKAPQVIQMPAREIISDYLKEMFLSKLPNLTLKERAIQVAFAYTEGTVTLTTTLKEGGLSSARRNGAMGHRAPPGSVAHPADCAVS